MADSAVVSVTTTPTLLNGAANLTDVSGGAMVLRNAGAAAVAIGGSDVTPTTGLTLAASATLTLPVPTGRIYGVVASGSQSVEVLFL